MDSIIDLIEELKSLKFETKVIKQILSEIELDAPESFLKIGCRVKINWIDGSITLGRIVGIRKIDGAFYVHRDGYSGVICLDISIPGLMEHTLENLSIAYGRLDQKLWGNEKKINEINKSINSIVRNDTAKLSYLL